MKILLLTEFFPDSSQLKFTGGVEARTYFMAKNLAKENKVIVLCRKTQSLREKTRINKIVVYPCGPKTSRVEASFFSIFGRIGFILTAFSKGLKIDFDLIEGSNVVSFLPAFFLGVFKNKPKISWWPDVLKGKWLQNFGLSGIFGEIIERISLKLPWTGIISLSKSTQNKLLKEGILKSKIRIVYGGVESKKLKEMSLRIEKKKKRIICISRLVKYKRVSDLILAFEKLLKKYPQFQLFIVGQGPEEEKLKDLVNKKNLFKKVKFFKDLDRDKLLRLLAESYVFCLPSVIEGFGLVTIEALSCGVPYVIADIEVNKEITNNGEGGFLFKKKDAVDLERKIDILLKNEKTYRIKQKEGIKLAQKYDWKIIAGQTKKGYNKVIHE